MKKLIIFLFTVLISSSACADENAENLSQALGSGSVSVTFNK